VFDTPLAAVVSRDFGARSPGSACSPRSPRVRDLA